MKYTAGCLPGLSLLGGLLLPSVARAADVEVGAFLGSVVPGAQHELFDPASGPTVPIRPGASVGARLTVRPLPWMGGEIEAHAGSASVEGRGAASIYAYRWQVLGLLPLEKVQPFALLGSGNIGLRSDADALGVDLDWALHAGLGARVPISDSWSVRTDVRMLLADRNVDLGTSGVHSEFFVGAAYRLGDAPDRDADGVSDRRDRCRTEPETVNGYMDDDGCPDALASIEISVRGSDGLPARGVEIVQAGRVLGKTDRDGRLIVDGWLPGTDVSLSARHSHILAGEPHVVRLGPSSNPVAFSVDWLPGRVRVITLANGTPVQGAQAAFSGERRVGPLPVEGGDDVFFLDPGHWTGFVVADDFGSKLVEIDVQPNETALLTIELELGTPMVQLTQEEIRILQEIRFASGSAAILGESDDIIREVTATLLANPQIRRVEIQGHTDNVSDAASNRVLSQARVDSVMRWLVEHGVSASLLEAKGYGEDVPVGPNDTEEGRARNRRVIFKVLETGP